MNNKIISVIVILVLVAGAFILFKDKSVAPTNIEEVRTENTEESTIRELNVETNNFSFSTRVISVNKGDTVKINFKNVSGTHNFMLNEFNVATEVLKAGESETITFVADKSGTFEYYCSVGTHRQIGMAGKLIVN